MTGFMKSMIRFLLPLLLLTALLTFDTARVAACTCAGDMPFITYVTGADAIFAGKVIAQEEATTPDQYSMYATPFVINVTKVWKGANLPTITVATNHSTCAYFFEVGKEYLIFAHAMNGQLYSDLCSRNQLLETAGRDIALLDNLFTPSASLAFHSSATITVYGESTYLGEADLLSVRFVIEENDTDLEKQRTQLHDALLANNVPTSILTSLYSDGKDFYLSLRREQFSTDELVTFLEQLMQSQAAVVQASQLPIQMIEVMAGLEDCTLPLVSARRGALWNAQTRAELLAVLMGGRTDTVMAVTEEVPNETMAGALGICDALRWRQWHELPLAVDLSAMMQITAPVVLRVTFGVKPLITGESLAPAKAAPATATPRFLSPLATPTP